VNEHQIFAIQRFWDAKESWEYHMAYANKNAIEDAGWRMASAAGDCKILHALVDGDLGGPGGLGGAEAVPGAGYLLAEEVGGVEGAGGVGGLALHGVRDALVGEAAALPLATLGLVVLALLDGARRRGQPAAAKARQASRLIGARAPYTVREAAGRAGGVELSDRREISRREVLRYGGAGAVALALGASGLVVWPPPRTHGAAEDIIPWISGDIELFINDGLVEMIDGTPVYMWGFGDSPDALRTPGPVIWGRQGEPFRISVTNNLNEDHSFFIDGIVDSGVIAPGETKHLSFEAPAAGTYLYQDGVNAPVNRVLGLHGAMVIMVADRTMTPFPGGDQWTFATQWVWVLNEIDPAWSGRAQADLPIDPDEFKREFLPRYFTINGRSGSMASHTETAPDTAVHDRIGNPALIRMVNAGLAMHSPHFHGNHVYLLTHNGEVLANVMWKDNIMMMPGDRKDVLLPFAIPPNAVHWPPPLEGQQFLRELGQSEGAFPMHCHVEMSQVAGGGLYPQGMLTDWVVEL